jgi:hypothetical protein
MRGSRNCQTPPPRRTRLIHTTRRGLRPVEAGVSQRMSGHKGSTTHHPGPRGPGAVNRIQGTWYGRRRETARIRDQGLTVAQPGIKRPQGEPGAPTRGRDRLMKVTGGFRREPGGSWPHEKIGETESKRRQEYVVVDNCVEASDMDRRRPSGTSAARSRAGGCEAPGIDGRDRAAVGHRDGGSSVKGCEATGIDRRDTEPEVTGMGRRLQRGRGRREPGTERRQITAGETVYVTSQIMIVVSRRAIGPRD